MSVARNAREIVLLDEVTITGTGSHGWKCPIPPWTKNPRFQLVVSDTVGSGSASIALEHALIDQTNVETLHPGVAVTGDGSKAFLTEELSTAHPFARIRANVKEFSGLTSFKAKLVGMFDKE